MATSEKSGKPKKVGRPKSSTKSAKSQPKTGAKKSGSKKGGNFLGAVGELVAPAGWGSFATAAALVGIDQADAAFRRGKSEKSSVKKGGAPNNNLKTRHPYELLSGIRPDADNEAMRILQSNRYLTNAFLRLYNHAYHLESETAKL